MLVASCAVAQGSLVIWWIKGFSPAEDTALQTVIEKWEKKTGGKVDFSMIAAVRRYMATGLTAGAVKG